MDEGWSVASTTSSSAVPPATSPSSAVSPSPSAIPSSSAIRRTRLIGLGWPDRVGTGADAQAPVGSSGRRLGWPEDESQVRPEREVDLVSRETREPGDQRSFETPDVAVAAPMTEGWEDEQAREPERGGLSGLDATFDDPRADLRPGQTNSDPIAAPSQADWEHDQDAPEADSTVATWESLSGPDGRLPEYLDGPMIAGSYSGAVSAQAESEDEVAIPSAPDTSADTPIARAAQAAMKARASNQPWPRPSSCRILTIANQKGGVGKTTTAVNLAASLAMHGSKVLVVDLDPQGNASTALDVEHRSGVQSIYNVLVDGRPLAEVIRPVQGFPLLNCAPATIDLAGAEIELVPLVARESRLARAVTEYDVSTLDYIFIDCPPSLGLLTVNALVAAPEVLIPIQCEYYALEGLEQLLRTVELVRSHLNPNLKVSTILLTMFDSRTRLASQVADEVRSHFGEQVLSSIIPRSVRVSEAPSYGQSVMTYDPGSSGAVAYLEAARELAFRNAGVR